jgi:undecaprenyl-diphosphatase
VSAAPTDPGARHSLRVLLRSGPFARKVALLDLRLFRFVRHRLHSTAHEDPVRRFSNLGEYAACWYVIGVAGMALDREHRPRWRRALVALGATHLLAPAIKNLIRRPRPVLEDLPQLVKVPTQLSFPSTHSATSFAGARAFAPLLPGGDVLYGVAAAMAFSRVYLGVHFPSDIAAGALLGSLVGNLGRS